MTKKRTRQGTRRQAEKIAGTEAAILNVISRDIVPTRAVGRSVAAMTLLSTIDRLFGAPPDKACRSCREHCWLRSSLPRSRIRS